jgi:tetratricopeptide (TPR) repeat protein
MCFALAFGSTTPEAGYLTLDELSDDVGRSRSIEASALSTRAWFASMEGSYEEARRLAWLAVEIEESLGSRLMVAINHEVVAAVELAAGDVPAAEHATRIKYDILEETGHDGFRSTAAAELALCLCALGRFDEAEGYAATARDLAAEDDLPSQASGRQAQALVLASRGEFEAAEQLGREAVQLLEDAEAPQAQGHLRMDLARVLRMAGKSAEAEQIARAAIAFFERKGDRSSITSARAFLADV